MIVIAGLVVFSTPSVLRAEPQHQNAPAGGDPVTVEVGAMDGARWRDLWLSGPVRRIGTVTLDPGLGLG